MKYDHVVNPFARKWDDFGKRSRPTCVQASILILLLSFSVAGAAPLTLKITNPDRIGLPGTSEVFSGTIANNTGVSLNASDLFLDFSGYDVGFVTLTQLLGAPGFAIADGTVSSFNDLFRFDLGAAAQVPATFFADVVVQDVNNNFSDVTTVSVSTVPEPGIYGLTGLALIAGYFTRAAAATRRRAARLEDPSASATSRGSVALCNGGTSC